VDGTQLAAIASNERDVIVWNYPNGEILFQKKLDKWMHGIEWNPFKPNVFATFGRVSCLFISNLFPRIRNNSYVISICFGKIFDQKPPSPTF
jgi:hypothetical protein